MYAEHTIQPENRIEIRYKGKQRTYCDSKCSKYCLSNSNNYGRNSKRIE